MFNRVKFDNDFQMLKLESLNGFAKDFMSERLVSSTSQIYEEIQKNGNEISREYLEICNKLFKKCIMQQKNATKGDISFMYFFYLRSAMITKKHEIQINMYTKDGYMDKTETLQLWYPKFIMNIYEQDMEDLNKAAKDKIIHYGYPQYMELRERCFSFYILFVREYIISEIPKVVLLDSYKEIRLSSDFQIVFGGYMDKGIRIWPIHN